MPVSRGAFGSEQRDRLSRSRLSSTYTAHTEQDQSLKNSGNNRWGSDIPIKLFVMRSDEIRRVPDGQSGCTCSFEHTSTKGITIQRGIGPDESAP
jgi:hypothetical protein